MIFAQHYGSWFADAARSAEGVLLLGRVGQGVGLISDLLAAAAAECGLAANCEELHGFAPLRPWSAAAVWLGASETPPALTGRETSRFDVVMALDHAAIRVGYPLARPNGRILLPVPRCGGLRETRFTLGANYDNVLSARPRLFIAGPMDRRSTESIGYLAGCLSGCISLPSSAWHVALDAHLRPRDRRSARAMFSAGRRQTSPARYGLR